MKLLFISDIHGSSYWVKQALAKFAEEQADQIVLVGDSLYHGPRNPLPEEYNPQEVARQLNVYKEKIVAVRGNCDAEVDQLLLEFPMMAEYAILYHEKQRFFVTHGHHHHMDHLPPLAAGDAFIQGHTHVPVAEKRDGIILFNPGSISLPKEGFPPSYGVFADGVFAVKAFDGTVLKSVSLA